MPLDGMVCFRGASVFCFSPLECGSWGPWGYLDPEPAMGRWKPLGCPMPFCAALRAIPGEAPSHQVMDSGG